MRQEVASWIMLGGFGVLSIVVIAVGSQVHDLDTSIAALVRKHLQPEKTMQTLEQDVTRLNGDVVHVTTTRGAEEDLDAFIARHDATVAALKAS